MLGPLHSTHLPRWACCLPHLILFALAFAPESASAAVVYVNKNASGSKHDGASWATAFLTVQAGVAAAVAHDEVWVAASKPATVAYVENVTLKEYVEVFGGFSGTETTRDERDWRKNVTVLDGNGNKDRDVVRALGYGIVLDGFAVRNGGAGIAAYRATVRNCAISGNGYGVEAGEAATIENSTITMNSRGISILWNFDIKVRNCNISGNSESGIFAQFGGVNATNCTITANSVGIMVFSGKATVTNCIVGFNEFGFYQSDTTITFANNCVYGNQSGNYSRITDPTGTNGNISEDPQLSNAYHDTHIQPGSPCRDAGNDAVVGWGWTDIDNQPRTQGAHIDIGADESDGTVWSVPSLTWYVNPGGDDTADGLSWATAKKTVGGALGVAQGTDEVWVAGGVYLEHVTIPAGVGLYGGFSGTETERGERNWKSNTTVLDDNHGIAYVVTAEFPNAVLDGFSVRNGRVGVLVSSGPVIIANCIITGNEYHGIYAVTGHITVVDCAISGNATHGIFATGGMVEASDCVITGNIGDGIKLNYATVNVSDCSISGNSNGIRIEINGRSSVANCKINENRLDGIYTAGRNVRISDCVVSGANRGIYVALGPAIVTNCTITANTLEGLYAYYGETTTTNCVVSLNGTGVRVYRISPYYPMNLSHNDVFGNTSANYTGLADPTGTNGNISVDPLFVDRENRDYHLNLGSPCTDAGDDSVVTSGQTDLDRNPRISGARVDMGAYETIVGELPYALSKAIGAMKVAGGLAPALPGDMARLDVDGDGVVTILDLARIARKVAGLEVNP